MFRFKFQGKSSKRDNKVFKFHAFIITADKREVILYDAVKKGFVDHERGSDEYYSHFPQIKIFSSTSGFGIRRAYQSFFFRLDASSNREVSVRPLGYEVLENYEDCGYFKGNGIFLTPDEIAELVGEDSNTFKFYRKQTYLSKRELQDLIVVNYVNDLGEVARVRHIRF